MDKIHLRGLRFFAFHGVRPAEKRDGQEFVLDVTLELDLSVPCRTDRLADTVSYSDVYRTVGAAMTEKSYDLIERAAGEVAARLLSEYPALAAVTVILKKPLAPVKGRFEWMGVEIRREREHGV